MHTRWSGLAEEKKKNKDDDDGINPLIFELAQRVTRLEEKTNSLDKTINLLKEKIDRVENTLDKIDGRTWAIIAGIVVSIAIEILVKVW